MLARTELDRLADSRERPMLATPAVATVLSVAGLLGIALWGVVAIPALSGPRVALAAAGAGAGITLLAASLVALSRSLRRVKAELEGFVVEVERELEKVNDRVELLAAKGVASAGAVRFHVPRRRRAARGGRRGPR